MCFEGRGRAPALCGGSWLPCSCPPSDVGGWLMGLLAEVGGGRAMEISYVAGKWVEVVAVAKISNWRFICSLRCKAQTS